MKTIIAYLDRVVRGSCVLILGLVACATSAEKASTFQIDRQAASVADKPKCVAIGTKSEGWSLKGYPIAYDNCKDRYIECTQDGWTSYAKKDSTILVYANCTGAAESPKCVAIGTKSEGWSVLGKQIIYDNCANKGVACGAEGTRSEAWITFEKEDPRVIFQVKCSNNGEEP